MLKENSNFVKVAAVSDVAEGKPRAVRVEGHSIALFQHEGAVYATDNQCPHMGYPLVRGARQKRGLILRLARVELRHGRRWMLHRRL